jgi:hypothetical protein
MNLSSEYNPIKYYIGDVPTRIACFQSKSKRFPPLATTTYYGPHIGPGAYWPDEQNKSESLKNKKRSASPTAAFKSGTSRFTSATPKPIVEPKYKLENDERVWTGQGRFFTITKTSRFSKAEASSAPVGMGTRGSEGFHSDYDTDTTQSTRLSSIGKWVQNSSLKYSNISSSTERFSDVKGQDDHIGPGTYDPRPATAASAVESKRPSSSFQSNSNRFTARVNTAPGSTFSLESDKKVWAKHGFPWSTQERFPIHIDI